MFSLIHNLAHPTTGHGSVTSGHGPKECCTFATYVDVIFVNYAQSEDRQLALMVSGGDRNAFAELYTRYGDAVASICKRIVGADQTDDLVHDVFLALWQYAADFDPERGSMLTWLVVRARSRSLDRVRSQKRRRELLDEHQEVTRPRTPTPPGERAVERSRLKDAVEQLEPELREVVKLAYYDGASSSEIAEELGIPMGTVKSRIRRAREVLAAIVKEDT